MIFLLLGENEFEKRERVREITAEFSGEVRRVDGSELERSDIYEVLMGQTLFGGSTGLVATDLSESPAWSELPEIIGDKPVELVAVEGKIDKRTKVYKWFKANAKIEEYETWRDWDTDKAIKWAINRAKDNYGYKLESNFSKLIIDRLGVDQMRIDAILDQLSLVDKIDQETIDSLVPQPKMENVFELMNAVVAGDRKKIHDIIAYLEMSSSDDGEAFRTLGLISSQLIRMSAIMLSGGDMNQVLADFGGKPSSLGRLRNMQEKVSIERLRKMSLLLSEADLGMKTIHVSPWLLLESSLMEMTE